MISDAEVLEQRQREIRGARQEYQRRRGQALRKRYKHLLPKPGSRKRGGKQRTYESLAERIRDNIQVDKTTGCWISQFFLSADGYAMISSPYESDYRVVMTGPRKGRKVRKMLKAHRVSFECFNGPIPDDKEVGHTCNVQCCLNPKHLILQTHRENVDYMIECERQPRNVTRGATGMRRYTNGSLTLYFPMGRQPKGWWRTNPRYR